MKRFRSLLVMLGALTVCIPAVVAQGPPPGAQMPPEMRARMEAWRKWRDTHKNVLALEQTLRGLEEMEKDKKTQLTKAQAQKILPILKAWRGKPVMTDAQALKVNKQITEPLSIPQLKKIATASERGRRPGGGRPGGQGAANGPGARPGGQPGANGQRRFDPSRFPAPKDYNPLNPGTHPMERARERAKQRLDALTRTITARAR